MTPWSCLPKDPPMPGNWRDFFRSECSARTTARRVKEIGGVKNYGANTLSTPRFVDHSAKKVT